MNCFHYALSGDCLELLPRLPAGFADMVVADPPYNTANKNIKELRGRKPLSSDFGEWDYFEEPGYLQFAKQWVEAVARVVKPYGNLLVFCKLEYTGDLRKAYEKLGFRHHATVIWHKTNPSPQIRKKGFLSACEAILWAVNGFDQGKVPYTFNFKTQKEMHNFVETPICMGRDRTAHPTQKPGKLVSHLLEIFSNEGDIVLDPFAGSGTTSAVAMSLGRNSISMEKEANYFSIMKERLVSACREDLFRRNDVHLGEAKEEVEALLSRLQNGLRTGSKG